MIEQLSLLAIPAVDAAEEAARSLIRAYVKRGDDPKHIRAGGMGYWGEFRAQIGGYCDPFEEFGPNKKYGLDYIIVNRDIDGLDCVRVFNFGKIYEAVKAEL